MYNNPANIANTATISNKLLLFFYTSPMQNLSAIYCALIE